METGVSEEILGSQKRTLEGRMMTGTTLPAGWPGCMFGAGDQQGTWAMKEPTTPNVGGSVSQLAKGLGMEDACTTMCHVTRPGKRRSSLLGTMKCEE